MKKIALASFMIVFMGCSQLIPALFSDDPLASLAKSAEGIEVLGVTVMPAEKRVEIIWQLRDTTTNGIVTGGQIDLTLDEFKAIKDFPDLVKLIARKVMTCQTAAVRTGEAKLKSTEGTTQCQIMK